MPSALSIVGLAVSGALATPLVVMAALLARRLGGTLLVGPAVARLGVFLVESSVGLAVLLTLGSTSVPALIMATCGGTALGAVGIIGSTWLVRKEFRTFT